MSSYIYLILRNRPITPEFVACITREYFRSHCFLIALIIVFNKLGRKNKMKKKIVAVLLNVGLSVSLMTACGTTKAAVTDANQEKVSGVEQTSESVEEATENKSEKEVESKSVSENKTEEGTILNWRDYQTITINGKTIEAPFTVQDLIDIGAEEYGDLSGTIEPGIYRMEYILKVDDKYIFTYCYNPEEYPISVYDCTVYSMMIYSENLTVMDNGVTIGLVTNDMSYSDIVEIYGDADEFYDSDLDMISSDDLADQDEYMVVYGDDNSGKAGYMDVNSVEYYVIPGSGISDIYVTYLEQLRDYYGYTE
jgi:hypothetical protein